MPRLKITPNTTYDPGHLGRLLSQLGSGPVMNNADGSVTTILSDDQLAAYHRMGGSPHKVEVLPDVDPPSAVADTGTAPGSEPAPAGPRHVPTMEEVMAAGYSEDAAKIIIRRETKLAEGKTMQQAYQEMQAEDAAIATATATAGPETQPVGEGQAGGAGSDPGIIGGTNDAKVEPPVEEPPADLPPAA